MEQTSPQGHLLPLLLHAKVEENVESIRKVVRELKGKGNINLQQVELKLEALSDFWVVVAGEWNRGKSSLVNRLLEEDVQPTGELATTLTVTTLRSAHRVAPHHTTHQGVELKTVDNHWLQKLGACVVDTPGCNSTDPAHQALTKQFLPRADIVLLVLSVDQALSGTEKALLAFLRRMEKKVVYVLNKADYKTQSQLELIQQNLVRELIEEDLDDDPTVFVTSCLPEPEWSGGVSALREYLVSSLGQIERVIMKLDSLVVCFQESVLAERELQEREAAVIRPAEEVKASNEADIRAVKKVLARLQKSALSGIRDGLLSLRSRGITFLTNAPARALVTGAAVPSTLVQQLEDSEGGVPETTVAQLKAIDREVAESLYGVFERSRGRLIKIVDLPAVAGSQRSAQGSSEESKLAWTWNLVPPAESLHSLENCVAEPFTEVMEEVITESRRSAASVARGGAIGKGIIAGGSAACAGLTAIGFFPPAVAAIAGGLLLAPFHFRTFALNTYRKKTQELVGQLETTAATVWEDKVTGRLERHRAQFAPFASAVDRESLRLASRKRQLDDAEREVKRQRTEALTKLNRLKRQLDTY